VAVAAVDAVAADVPLVTERDGLFTRDAGAGRPGRLTCAARNREPARTKIAPKMLTRAIVFALR
jgi:hypothetical protein